MHISSLFYVAMIGRIRNLARARSDVAVPVGVPHLLHTLSRNKGTCQNGEQVKLLFEIKCKILYIVIMHSVIHTTTNNHSICDRYLVTIAIKTTCTTKAKVIVESHTRYRSVVWEEKGQKKLTDVMSLLDKDRFSWRANGRGREGGI